MSLMLSNICAECRKLAHYAEWCYAECRGANLFMLLLLFQTEKNILHDLSFLILLSLSLSLSLSLFLFSSHQKQ